MNGELQGERTAGRTVFLLVTAACLCAAGCAGLQNERLSLSLANRTLGTTMGVLADLRRAGKISDEQADLINEFYPKAEAALDAWREALEADAHPEAAINRFRRALSVLDRILRQSTGCADDADETTKRQELLLKLPRLPSFCRGRNLRNSFDRLRTVSHVEPLRNLRMERRWTHV
jgi:hypothetical protein